MELSYWESRWKKDKTGFHMPGGYSALKSHWPKLTLPEAPAVLVPLCGKSADMIFMENQGAQITGVEISEKAVRSFFKENERNFERDTYADFTIRWSGNIQIWQGDFMKFPDSKADVDLIYDKAALVALPPEKRQTYADKLLSLAGPGTQILLHHFTYPQQEMPDRHLVSAAMKSTLIFQIVFLYTCSKKMKYRPVNSFPFRGGDWKARSKNGLF